MMSSPKSKPVLDAKLESDCSRQALGTRAPRKLSVHAASIVAVLRDLAPYALIELVLPGGSLMALLLWLYRRPRQARLG
jgi:hypothetical protein